MSGRLNGCGCQRSLVAKAACMHANQVYQVDLALPSLGGLSCCTPSRKKVAA